MQTTPRGEQKTLESRGRRLERQQASGEDKGGGSDDYRSCEELLELWYLISSYLCFRA